MCGLFTQPTTSKRIVAHDMRADGGHRAQGYDPPVPDWKVPLADVVISEGEIATVAEVYRSGWLSMGPETTRFEELFQAYTGSAHALAVANGTAGLHLICLGADLGAGDEVVVPSLTFVATVNAIRYTGATPVFADVVSVTEPWLSRDAAEAAITERTRAIMNVPYGGHPGDSTALAALAEERGLVLLEDAAHAVGARVDGRHLGTLGLGGAFSFFSNKNLPVGEGGMVVTDDDDVAERMRLLRSHGMTTLTWDRHRGHAMGYDVVALGYNYRIDEPRAALAASRLEGIDTENRRRGEHVAAYRDAFDATDGVSPTMPPADGAEPAHHLFTIVVDEGIDRDAVRKSLHDAQIQTSLHYPPAHHFSIYADSGAELPNTDAYAARAITLPLFGHMTTEQREAVVDTLATAVAQAG
jgi:dTDP-4-amino-4,6-dideoxygalactose transaminase